MVVMSISTKNLTLKQVFPYILLIGGIIGIFASGMLTIEKFNVLQNPGSQLGCDLNPIVACGPVINKPQASAFGVPNPFLGLVGFAVVATVGAALLAGAKFKRWFWLGLQAGVTFAVAFVTWLQFQTIFNIGALCPYCMLTWAVVIPIFWYTTIYNLKEKYIRTPKKLKSTSEFVQKHHGDFLLFWFASLLVVIIHHFWYYWKTLI